MKKYLIPMTDFVLEHPASTDYEWQLSNHLRYAKFLTQPLELWMFVPCDKNGDVLEFKEFETWSKSNYEYNVYMDKYQKAKEKVLFEGFDFIKMSEYYIIINSHGKNVWYSWNKSKPVENLLNEVTEVSLTETAIKQIYGC